VAILNPIGVFRGRYVIPSKGKRRKKRKRTEAEHASDGTGDADPDEAQMPAIYPYLMIGFNSTVRSLEAMSQRSKPLALNDADTDAGTRESQTRMSNLAAVFVCRSVLPNAVTASIPVMVATASLARPQEPPIRLLQLPAHAESQLSEALNHPRVGFVGICVDAPGGDILLALVRAAVGPVEAPWLETFEIPRYLPVQIESIETSTGSKDKSKKPAYQSQSATRKGKSNKVEAEAAAVKLKTKSLKSQS